MIQAVPTYLITGFLGVGKTTTISHLLQQKPHQERWAVLVNEFGEIGIDGSLLSGQKVHETGFFIREVPGGCMCCTAGLPMQIALNQLLQRAKPQRLLIEPTGLGHPQEVIETLRSYHYKEIIELKTTATLVDARKVSDERYTKHDTFNQQLDVADIIIANKTDLYDEHDAEKLQTFLQATGRSKKSVYFVEQGNIQWQWLEQASHPHKIIPTKHEHAHAHAHAQKKNTAPSITDNNKVVSVQNQGEGYQSIGWKFPPNITFDREQLFVFLSGLTIERAKGVFITEHGIFGYNITKDTISEIELDETFDSRLEILTDTTISPVWEQAIHDCIAKN